MRLKATPLLLGILAALVLSTAPARAASLFFDYVGFDYESPNPNPGDFGEPGAGYVGLGYVPNLFAPLVADTTQYQYTYVVSGMTPVSRSFVGPYAIIDYSPGTLSIYEDSKSSGTYADYGVNPPNATAPGTFTDGTLFVTGTLTSFRFVVNLTNGTGSYEANYTVTGGSQLANVPLSQRTGWTFAGSTGNALNIPAGYSHQIDGQNFVPDPVRARGVSWGALKATYR